MHGAPPPGIVATGPRAVMDHGHGPWSRPVVMAVFEQVLVVGRRFGVINHLDLEGSTLKAWDGEHELPPAITVVKTIRPSLADGERGPFEPRTSIWTI